MAKRRIGIWIRVSTDMQAKGESPEHHEERARYHANLHGFEVIEVYHLEAVSGKSVMGHHEAKRMLGDIKRGHIDALIFSKIARLARNIRELLEIADIFEKHNADLISIEQPIDTTTPSGKFHLTFLGGLAEWEREEISERVASSVNIRAKLGKPLGGQAPFGYQFVEGKLMLHPEESAIRKEMYSLYLECKRKKTTANLLNERGYRTRNGSLFTSTTLTRLLQDPIGKGIRLTNYTSLRTGERVIKDEGDWVFQEAPAIIDEETWNRVQSMLKDNAQPERAIHNRKLKLFTGYVVCHCGSKMYAPSNNPKYICYTCKNKIPKEDLEGVFKEQLQTFVLSENTLEKLIHQGSERLTECQHLLASLLKQKTEVKEKIDALIDLHLSKQLEQDSFKRYHDPLYLRLLSIEEEETRLKADISQLKNHHETVGKVVIEARDLYSKWDDMGKDHKRSIIEAVVNTIVIFPDMIEINLRKLLASFNSWQMGHESMPMWLLQPSRARMHL